MKHKREVNIGGENMCKTWPKWKDPLTNNQCDLEVQREGM